MSTRLFHDEEEDESIFQRHRWLMPVIAVAACGGIGYAATQFKGGPSAPVRAPERMMMISLPPPPPPPPPPPKIEPPKVEPPKEEIKQEMIQQEEVKPDEKPPEPKQADEPPALTTNNVGPGSDGLGLGAYKPGSGNGNGIGGPRGGGGGSKFGWYAAKVQTTVAEAMRRNGRTRTATLSVQVRVWADSDGRITRAQLVGSSGDAGVDSALTGEVLTGLRLEEPPPKDMPMPIVMRLSAKKPH